MYVWIYVLLISCGNLCQLHVRHNFRTSETGKIASFLLVNQFLLGLISSHLFKKMLIYNFYRDLFLFINHNTSKKKKHNLRLSIFFSFCKSSLSSKQTWALSERSNPVVSIYVFFRLKRQSHINVIISFMILVNFC